MTQVNPKLMALAPDALLKLREEVNAAFDARRGEFLRLGRICWLFSEKHQRNVRVQIIGFGTKYVQAAEINEYDSPTGIKWRVPSGMLNPELPKAKPTMVRGTGADAPGYAHAGSF